LLRCPILLDPKDKVANVDVKSVIVSASTACTTKKPIKPRQEGRSGGILGQVKRASRHLEASLKTSNGHWTRILLIVTWMLVDARVPAANTHAA
jgi:hypothetical protein